MKTPYLDEIINELEGFTGSSEYLSKRGQKKLNELKSIKYAVNAIIKILKKNEENNCKHCKEEVFEEPWDICKTCEEVEIPDFLLNSKKLKLSLYHKGMKDNITFKLNAVDNQWLVIKSISDKYTHKLPICEIEIKELKQFLNKNYPEL